jgi:hypothetical protein
LVTVSIPLTQGKVALIDEEDLPLVSQYKWHAVKRRNGSYCARCYVRGSYGEGRSRLIYMHCLILDPPEGVLIDHWDRDELNNTRKNLRYATPGQNQHNRGKTRKNSTGYKGVYLNKQDGRYFSSIDKDRKTYRLGSFGDPESAAHAYDKAALILHGDFAVTNFPKEQYSVSTDVGSAEA